MNDDISLDISSCLTVAEMTKKYYGGQNNIIITVIPIGNLRGGFKF